MALKIVAVDLFCGAGGLTRGLLDAGVEVRKGFDNDGRLKDTFEKNNPGAKFISKHVADITGQDILEGINRDDCFLLLAGCAPCQPFSSMLKVTGKKKKRDSRGNLLLEFGRLIIAVKPDFVFAENVPGLKNGKGKRIFRKFERILEKEGYRFVSDTLDAKDYGVPQKRRRLVLLASLHGQVTIPYPTHGTHKKATLRYITVQDAIKRFPVIRAGSRHKKIVNHETRDLSDLNKKRLRYIKKNGGSRTDLPGRLALKCHKDHEGHTDVYGRMKWEELAPTLTCKCTSLSNGRFGHPSQLRAISVREAAALQTFNDDYIFYGNISENTRWVGNAVPPRFAGYLVREGLIKSVNGGIRE